jgi:hypothetical protein
MSFWEARRPSLVQGPRPSSWEFTDQPGQGANRSDRPFNSANLMLGVFVKRYGRVVGVRRHELHLVLVR